jgi:hypothetical protein
MENFEIQTDDHAMKTISSVLQHSGEEKDYYNHNISSSTLSVVIPSNDDHNKLFTKVFVGNVPFQCTNDEFKNCLKNIQGFVDAEIINRHNSYYNRGFGFVTLRTPDDAQKILTINNIVLKNRILRFADYNLNDKDILKQQNKKNYLFVRGISKDIKRSELVSIFTKFCEIGGCFIMTNKKTGEQNGNAIVEITNFNVYESLLNQKQIITPNKLILEVSKWKNKLKPIQYHNNKNQFINNNYNNVIGSNKNNIKLDAEGIFRMASKEGLRVGRLKENAIYCTESSNTSHVDHNKDEDYKESINSIMNSVLRERNCIKGMSDDTFSLEKTNFCENFIIHKNNSHL